MISDFEGIVNINKPVGITSFDVVSKLRRLFKIKRIGHCGTLDPFASGVLPVCIGRSTSAVRYMDNYDKKYRVEMVFGAKTDTQDRTGEVVFTNPPSANTLDLIRDNNYQLIRDGLSELARLELQLPPMYSAIKIDGKQLYKYARAGIEVERKPRHIKIYSAELISASADGQLRATVDIACSKGTYIRTVCSDLGDNLTFGAYADSLVRTQCGPFKIEDSITLEELAEVLGKVKENEKSLFESHKAFQPVSFALSHLKKVVLEKKTALRLIQGQKVYVSEQLTDNNYEDEEVLFVTDESGNFIGIVHTMTEALETENEVVDEHANEHAKRNVPLARSVKKGDQYFKTERIFADVKDYR